MKQEIITFLDRLALLRLSTMNEERTDLPAAGMPEIHRQVVGVLSHLLYSSCFKIQSPVLNSRSSENLRTKAF